jgi:hypothetical protein
MMALNQIEFIKNFFVKVFFKVKMYEEILHRDDFEVKVFKLISVKAYKFLILTRFFCLECRLKISCVIAFFFGD